MHFVFSTGSLYTYGIDRCFELAARAGFDGIELMTDRRWDTRQPAYLLRLVDRTGLPVVAVHAPLENAAVPGWPDDPPGRIHETVRLAEALGAGVMVHHLPLRVHVRWLQVGARRLPLPWPGADVYARWLLEEYAAFQVTTPVRLCIENLPAIHWSGRRWNPARWNSATEIVRFPLLTMDTTHLGTWGLDPVEVYDRLEGRVRHVHLSNFDGKEHRRPEVGHLPLDRLVAHLVTRGYEGVVSLEMSPDALGAGNSDDQVTAVLTASLEYCRRAAQNAAR
jgi:sugar phosphate isomerase/epimerase